MGLSQRQLAKHWGTSQPYVAKCVGKGCPTSDLQAANDWRAYNSPYGFGHRSKVREEVTLPAPAKALSMSPR